MKLPLTLPPAESTPFDAVGFGLNSLDLLVTVAVHPAPNSKHQLKHFAKMPGGEAASAMVACARQGWRARYVGSIGTDDHGDLVAAALIREGVDVSAARRIAGTNQMAVILVDEQTGTRTILWDRDPALTIEPDDVDLKAVTSGRILMTDAGHTAGAATAARAARKAGIPTVLDSERVRPGIDALLREIDVIIVAESFPTAFTGASAMGDGLRRLAKEFNAALTVVTLGEGGSLAICQGQEIRTPGFKVRVVDSTGAGDAFRGGFITGWLRFGQEAPVDTLLEYANAVAACKCRVLGAQAGLPTRSEVDALVTGRVADRSK